MGWRVKTEKCCLSDMVTMLMLMSIFLSPRGERAQKRSQRLKEGSKCKSHHRRSLNHHVLRINCFRLLQERLNKEAALTKGNGCTPHDGSCKGAAFDILQAASGYPASLRPRRWLDLYSGTGSVGIEALSQDVLRMEKLAHLITSVSPIHIHKLTLGS